MTYQIKVPEELTERWSDWAGGMRISFKSEDDSPLVTTRTRTLVQAALHGLLRQLYSLGLPLASVIFIEPGQANDSPVLNGREIRIEE